MMLAPLFGVAAAVVSLLDLVPYVRDMLRGTTRPHRGAWFVWSVLALVGFAAQLADGARWSLLMVGVEAVSMVLVFLLSLRFGTGGLGALDLGLTGVAGLGIVGWTVSAQPLVATTCVVAADAVGVALMLPKTWRDPWSETLSTYALAGASGVLGAAAVGAADFGLLLYPVYFAAANLGTAALIARRRRTIAASTAAPSGIRIEGVEREREAIASPAGLVSSLGSLLEGLDEPRELRLDPPSVPDVGPDLEVREYSPLLDALTAAAPGDERAHLVGGAVEHGRDHRLERVALP
jgi:hypothetical protein